MFFTSVTASVGNLNAECTVEKAKEVFDKMFFLNMCFYGISTSCIYNLANDFIRLWIGEDYLLSTGIMTVIVINYYISGMRQTCQTYNTTLGLFWNDRFKPWIEALINLVSSIALARYYGFMGILLGTLISTVTTSFWVEPYILYKHGFNMRLGDYFIRYGQYTAAILFATGSAFFLTGFMVVNSFAMWIVKAILVGMISVCVIVLCFYRKSEFIGLKLIVINLLIKMRRK